jgi:hypothetical protein
MSTPKKKQTVSNVLKSIDAIQELCAEPIKVDFVFAGRPCQIEARRLEPFEMELLKLQLDSALPPLMKGKTEADSRYDISAPEYLQKKAKIEREVRAQAIFWAVEEIQKKNPHLVSVMHNPSSRAAIIEAVQGAPGKRGVLTDEILETIYIAITMTEVSIPEAVNFSSPAGETQPQT